MPGLAEKGLSKGRSEIRKQNINPHDGSVRNDDDGAEDLRVLLQKKYQWPWMLIYRKASSPFLKKRPKNFDSAVARLG